MNTLRIAVSATLSIIAVAVSSLMIASCSARSPVATATATAAATAAAPSGGAGSLEGIWLNNDYKGSSSYPERERVLHAADGNLPPMLPWASELLARRIKDSEAGLPFASTLARCLPGGIPLMIFGDDVPVQIIETPAQLTMLFMEGNRFRAIPMNARHPGYIDPSFMGDSVGHWEGATLVVDNVGFRPETTLDQIGMPHTDRLHVVERYTRTGPEAMEIRVSIDDAGTFAAPWEALVHYRLAPAGTRVTEDVCENNRNLPDAQGRSGFQRF